ncbi:hypothetical protein Ddye_022067 [Dipteronia dyeriana]|uniref:RNase H type-1 domain-containing protein n=1 Tax=Dipteronia dyeriana TaxID=168575 RepID=A0AAD9U3C4_9ROSI|nr:hypothetical protein Ddye_022067 [Dipteronia dyeriana]
MGNWSFYALFSGESCGYEIRKNSYTRIDVDFVGWSMNFIECFRSENPGEDQVPIGGRYANINWCKPDRGWFKVNTDAAVNNLKCGIGAGIIIKNHLEVVRCCSIRNFHENFSPQITEAISLLCGIKLAVEENFVSAVIEFDAKAVVDMIKMGVELAADVGTIIGDILCLIFGKPISIFFLFLEWPIRLHMVL